MKPKKIGEVVKFHTPLPEENPDQLYVVLELIEDVESPRAKIKDLNTVLSFNPINTFLFDDLKIAKVYTADLIGYKATINKTDYSQATGKIIKVSEQNVALELTKGIKGIETKIFLTLQAENGQ